MVINVATRVQCGHMYVSTVATCVNSVACLSLSSNGLNSTKLQIAVFAYLETKLWVSLY